MSDLEIHWARYADDGGEELLLVGTDKGVASPWYGAQKATLLDAGLVYLGSAMTHVVDVQFYDDVGEN